MHKMIYLDHAATTPVAPEVLEAMLPWLTEHYGNAASDHRMGRAAKAAIEAARAQVAALIAATPQEILFTSGATESNNLAIKGVLEFRGLSNAHVITSRSEHKCVLDTCRYLESRGLKVSYLKPDAVGCISAEQVMAALTPQTVLVSLMWVNNETGSVNAVKALAPLLRARGILLHVDAVQAAGKLPIDLAQTPIDLLSLSAHKMYGPKGVGALFVRQRPRARVSPQLHGGGQEQGMRSGTLPVHQIVGMGAAAALASVRLSADAEHFARLNQQLWAALQGEGGVLRNGAAESNAPHILNLSFEGVEGESLRALLPSLAVSSGAACSSATAEPSYVLRALGRSDALANASLRFSFGRNSSSADVTRAAAAVQAALLYLRAVSGFASASCTALSEDIEQAYDYPAPIWQRLLRAGDFTGPLPAADGQVIELSAENRAVNATMRISLRIHSGVIQAVRIAVFGCPVSIAVAVWLAEQLLGKSSEQARQITPTSLRTALEIPEEKLHCALMGEDLLAQIPLGSMHP